MEPYPSPYEDVPASQIYMSKDVRKFGMLKKKTGGMKIPLFQDKYDLRFVIIHKGWVYYYKDKSSDKPQNKFSLQGFSNTVINAEEEEASQTFVFKVYSKKANERTWYFATETKLDMEQWMEAFRLEIEQYNVRGISNIRSSKSCPEKPVPGSLGLARHEIKNGRPQSVHAAPPIQPGLSESQFSSRTNMTVTSGIGSSTQSIEPEDYYEPVDSPDYDDEFDTSSDDSEYEKPATGGGQIQFYPQPSRGTDSLHPYSPQTSSRPSSQPVPSIPLQKYQPPPVVPPRDPVRQPISLGQDNPPQRHSIFEELERKMSSTRHPMPEPVQSSPSRRPPFISSTPGAHRHLYPSPEPIPSPPCRDPPVFSPDLRQPTPMFPPSPSPQFSPPPPRPLTSHKTPFQFPHDRSTQPSKPPVHLRHRSEDTTINREHVISPSEHLKRHSSPFSQMHERLAEQLATKLGQPTSPGREHKARQRPWSMAPVTPDHRDVGSPSYHQSSAPVQQLSPHDRRTLQPLPELPCHDSTAMDRPTDLPSRPPPLPPGVNSGINSFSHGSHGLPTSPDHFSNNATLSAHNHFPTLPNKLEDHIRPIDRGKFPALPAYSSNASAQPPLPPKPQTPRSTSRAPMPAFVSPDDQYDDTGHIVNNYDDNVDDGGVYDLPEEQESYEQTSPTCEPIDEALYEQEERINRPIPPLPPGKKPNLNPTLHPKPTTNAKNNCEFETGSSWNPLSNPSTGLGVKKNNDDLGTSKFAWRVEFKPTTSPDVCEKKQPWAKPPLSSAVDSKAPVKTASTSSIASTRPPWATTSAPTDASQKQQPLANRPFNPSQGFEVPAKTTSPSSEATSRPPWVRTGARVPSATAQSSETSPSSEATSRPPWVRTGARVPSATAQSTETPPPSEATSRPPWVRTGARVPSATAQSTETSPSSEATSRPPWVRAGARIPSATATTQSTETVSKPSWLKQNPMLAQKPPSPPKKPWQKDPSQSSSSSDAAKVAAGTNSEASARPPVAPKPNPTFSSKPVQSHNTKPSNPRPPPLSPKPKEGAQNSNFNKIRDKFVHQ